MATRRNNPSRIDSSRLLCTLRMYQSIFSDFFSGSAATSAAAVSSFAVSSRPGVSAAGPSAGASCRGDSVAGSSSGTSCRGSSSGVSSRGDSSTGTSFGVSCRGDSTTGSVAAGSGDGTPVGSRSEEPATPDAAAGSSAADGISGGTFGLFGSSITFVKSLCCGTYRLCNSCDR